ncbi:MAG: hypothetical protein IJZ87_07605 [Bacteroidales bacterium]|nr:hypothetical protein [Bacteroidales bacterium]
MRNKVIILLMIVFSLSLFSCDEEFDRTFHTSVIVYNLTANNDSIYIEQTISVDSIVTYLIGYEHNCWNYHIGTYYGYINQKFPPEDFVMESMPEITIYRQKNGEITYLPEKYYDDLDDFILCKDVFFDTHDVMYVLEITDEMFEE